MSNKLSANVVGCFSMNRSLNYDRAD